MYLQPQWNSEFWDNIRVSGTNPGLFEIYFLFSLVLVLREFNSSVGYKCNLFHFGIMQQIWELVTLPLKRKQF